MKSLGAGVIGLRMGISHLQAYQANPNVEVLGVCDVDAHRAEEIARQFGIKVAVTDYRKLLEMPELDLVSVASPDQFHAEQSIAAMKAGKHVLCEKPMAMTIEECQEMIKVSDETGMKFMVGQVCRFTPSFRLAKRLIDQNVIGDLFFVESEYAHNYSKIPGVGNWRKDPVRLRHPFLGGACHAVDLVRWIAGDVEETFAYANRKCLIDWPVDDCTIAIYKFKSGAIGKVFCSIGCWRPYSMRSVFYGTKGTIISDNTSPQIWLYHSEVPELSDFATIPVKLTGKPIQGEIDAFIDCLVNDKPIEMDAREGTRTVAACLAAVDSAKIGKPVKIEAIF